MEPNECDVFLNIKGSHVEGRARRATEFYTEGRLAQAEGKYVLEYDDAGGADRAGAVTRLTMDGPDLWFARPGSAPSPIRFRERQMYEAAFATPQGQMRVSILPTQVDASLASDSGDIDLEYIVRVGQDSALNRLNIHYQRRS